MLMFLFISQCWKEGIIMETKRLCTILPYISQNATVVVRPVNKNPINNTPFPSSQRRRAGT